MCVPGKVSRLEKGPFNAARNPTAFVVVGASPHQAVRVRASEIETAQSDDTEPQGQPPWGFFVGSFARRSRGEMQNAKRKI